MAKNQIFNYKICVYGGIGGILAIGGEVWIHHLYVTGMPDWLRIGMMISTLLISIPVGLIVMSLWGTLWRAAITYNVAMMYAAAMLYLIMVGGLTGIPLAMTSLTVHLSETSFIHAHFHFIMGLFSTYGVFAAVYYWFPKMTGRMADNSWAFASFWLNFTGINVTFWPLFIIGPQGMPRRYWNYEMFPQFENYHVVATVGAFLTAAGVAIMVINWIMCAIAGPKAPANPWNSKSLEWTHAPNPPGPGNFPEAVTVADDWTPYDYNKDYNK
jgi:cytochrome c oxidase subunit 1